MVTSKPAKGKRTRDMKLFYTNPAGLGKMRRSFRSDQQTWPPTNGREMDAFGFAFKGRF